MRSTARTTPFFAHQGRARRVGNPNAGQEAWGFIPSEILRQAETAARQSAGDVFANRRAYFADGPIGVYQKDANNDGRLVAADGDKVQLFIGMRRGDRLLYALRRERSADAQMLWKKQNTDTGYGEMGYTWSEPKVARMSRDHESGAHHGLGDTTRSRTTKPFRSGRTRWARGVMVIDATDGNCALAS
jgi:type IV pilus assembly protein PilY1